MKENKKKADFSVLMSIYARSNADHFRVALNSIFEQTVLPKQLIIVKDGPLSNDVENIILEITQKLEDIELKVINLQDNVGLGLALSKGVLESDYELIARMDSDDIAARDRFEIQLTMFEQNSNLDLVGGQLKEFSGELKNLVGSRSVPLSQDKIIDFAKKRNPFNHPTVMFKKSSVLNIGNYVDYRGFEDYYLWLRAINRGLNLENSPENFLFMRVENDLYARRGGIDYLKRYYRLKAISRKLGIGNFWDVMYCDLLMTMNVLAPIWIRKFAYRLLMHRK